MVVGDYLESGSPVGSKAIAEKLELEWGPSTIRAELAALERQGLLTHPHTSAGRVPTDAGYRLYAGSLLVAGLSRAEGPGELDLSRMRREVDEAMRSTTTALSRMTDLLALATAPAPSAARIHRVEVLLLQPNVAMVVVITSNGAVTKRVFDFERQLDHGLVEWASSYLNERLAGLSLGARMIGGRIQSPELSPPEAAFIAELATAFDSLDAAGEDLYMDGTSRLLTEARAADLPAVESVMGALERRAGLLGALRTALDERSVFVWVGEDNPDPELRSVSVVGANYGLGYRNLGTVGVVGPTRMDYATAIGSVREAAGQLSRFFETVYE
jgi:heat-inducible transcriptional repressor